MSTKQHTNTTNLYDKPAYNAYNAFQPELQSQLMQMAENPLGSSFFQTQAGMAQAQANALSQRNTSTAMKNLRTGGGLLSNSAGFLGAQAQKGALAASSMGANAFQNALSTALNNRNYALSSMEGYQPLQTGSATQQYSTGAGTWLPQVMGLAMNALMPGISGMMGGGSFTSGYRAPTSFNSIAQARMPASGLSTSYTPSSATIPFAPAQSSGYNPFIPGYAY